MAWVEFTPLDIVSRRILYFDGLLHGLPDGQVAGIELSI
jgi:hypothetical protein